ncbi:hypothetical protein JCM10049v2_001194 [Rhodotorula toruloides]
MGATEGSARVTAGYGVAVRLLCLVKAGLAFQIVEDALAFLDEHSARTPPTSSAPLNPPVLRVPPETWANVRAHLIALGVEEAEQELLRVFIDHLKKHGECFDPSEVPSSFTEGELWSSANEAGAELPDDVGEWFPSGWETGVFRLGTYFGLEVDLSPIRPQTLVEGNDTDYTLDSAVLLQLPSEDNGIEIETHTGIDLVSGFGCFGLPKSLPVDADKSFKPLIMQFDLDPVEIRLRQAKLSTVASVKEEAEERLFKPDDDHYATSGHFPSIPRDKVEPKWLIVCVTSLQA